MTDTTIAPKAGPVAEDLTKDLMRKYVAKAVANPAKLEFPIDKWGFTSDIKKIVLRQAATVRGNEEKHALLLVTLGVLLQHIKLRLPVDKAAADNYRSHLDRAAKERAPRERISAPTVAPVK